MPIFAQLDSKCLLLALPLVCLLHGRAYIYIDVFTAVLAWLASSNE